MFKPFCQDSARISRCCGLGSLPLAARGERLYKASLAFTLFFNLSFYKSDATRSGIMTKRYSYQPLDRSKKEIRLLELLPGNGCAKLKRIPACHMYHVPLYTKPTFVALSYVWGDATDVRLILVDDFPVQVTKNLYDAMMVLIPSKDRIVMWIDALCINQLDNKEKSWQVGLMADIYQQACKVVAWLGPADNTSDSVMDYLDSLGEKAQTLGMDNGPEPHAKIWLNLARKPTAVRDLSQSEITLITPTGRFIVVSRDEVHRLFYSISGWHDQDGLLPVAGMKRLFTRPWWGRIWVLQEITLPENTDLICGTKMITRRRCSAALNAYCALWSVLAARHLVQPHMLTAYHREILLAVFQHKPNVMLTSWNIYRNDKFPLAALLRATCVGSINLRRHGPHHLESTDPRDKIIALLSVAADQEELEGLGVFPDYTKSCKETYTIAMAALLRQGHMPMLSLCQSPKLQPDLPSWVPDWSRSMTDMLQDVENDHMTLYPKFSASGPALCGSPITIVKRDGKIEGISVVGCVYDEIFEVGFFPGRACSREVPILETYSWPVEWLAEILRLTHHKKRSYGNFNDCLRAAVRTSIGEVGYNNDARLVRVGDDRFLEAVILLQNGLQFIKDHGIKKDFQQLLANPAIKERIRGKVAPRERLGSEIIGKSLGRLPFITEKGHLLLSSEYVMRGDLIALIKGAQVPFVLRHHGKSHYHLISEAYVDGIMDGEAMESSRCSNITLV